MDKPGQKITYRLIISQLEHDNFLDIANQFEEILGIQSRAKNHLCELLESVNYQWKIASYYADTVCIQQEISKTVEDDLCVLPGHPATTNIRYDEKNCASKATSDVLFPSDEIQMTKKRASGITISSHSNNLNVKAHGNNLMLSLSGTPNKDDCHRFEYGSHIEDVEVEDCKSCTSSLKIQELLVLKDSKNDLSKPNSEIQSCLIFMRTIARKRLVLFY